MPCRNSSGDIFLQRVVASQANQNMTMREAKQAISLELVVGPTFVPYNPVRKSGMNTMIM